MTLTEDMKREAGLLMQLLEDPQPGLSTWQQAVNVQMSKLADLYFKPGDKSVPHGIQPKPMAKEPNFYARLRNQHVRITFLDGNSIQGILLKYSKYELLLQGDTTLKDKAPTMIPKHAVKCIDPLDENPFIRQEPAEDQMREGEQAKTGV